MALGIHHSPLPLPVEGDIPQDNLITLAGVIESHKVTLWPESQAMRDYKLVSQASKTSIVYAVDFPPQSSLRYSYCLGLPDYMYVHLLRMLYECLMEDSLTMPAFLGVTDSSKHSCIHHIVSKFQI